MIRARVPDWRENDHGGIGAWEFVDSDPDYAGRAIVVEGREGRYVWHPGAMPGTHYGPEILGSSGTGRHLHILLPYVTDHADQVAVIDALDVLDILPMTANSLDGPT